MKKKLLGLIFGMALISIKAQTFSDNFTSTWNPNTQGWVIINNSLPVGTTSVFQGIGSVFPAFNGGINDYVAMDWQNGASTTTANISTWLITPSLTIFNGVVLQFATATQSASTFADRLQVRMSTSNNTVIPTGTASVGSFTNLLLDINPNLSLNTSSVVSNGTVNGYPDTWALYTLTVSGVTGTVSGRFAFRYFVENNQANSLYVGIDAVKVISPCSASITSYTICANGSATLSATGGINPNSYTWSPGGSNNSTLVVTPASTAVYTLAYKDGNLLCPPTTATVTIGNQLSINVSASSNLICAGSSCSLIASGAANSYSWSNGGTGAGITVSPTVNTTYTVVGTSGTSPNICTGTNTIMVNILPSPNISITFSPAIICCNATVELVFAGATTYTSYLNTFPALVGNPISLFTDATDSNTNFTLMVQGTGTNGCLGSTTVIQYIQPLPTITIASPTIACSNSAITLTASGASTYTWSGPGSISGSANPATFNTPISTGLMNITANATTSLGCKGSGVRAITISDCVGLGSILQGQNDLLVFPNPFNQEIRITGYTGRAEISNAMGQLLIIEMMGNNKSIHTNELTKGIYTLRLFDVSGLNEKRIQLIKN